MKQKKTIRFFLLLILLYTFNGETMLDLSTQAILNVLGTVDSSSNELPIDPKRLAAEYILAESIGAEHVPLNDTDIVVVLSGRSGFSGTYLEAADKFTLRDTEYDPADTQRRMSYGIKIAKLCSQRNLKQGTNKPIYIYFNGMDAQNEELRALLQKHGEYKGYPAHLFIIDSIPFDNTLGQVLALSRFLDKYWPSYSQAYNLSRAPNLVICTSSYHVPRVTLAHGANSPLLTKEFWENQPDLVQTLSPSMRNYILTPGQTLKNSILTVLGCDRKITTNPGWEKDLKGDMEARVRYAFTQSTPSIATHRARNDVTFQRALEKISLYRLIHNLRWPPHMKHMTMQHAPMMALL